MSNSLSGLIPAFAALGAVVGLVLLAGRFVKAAGLARPQTRPGPADGHRLTILDTMMLDRTRRVHVIQWHDRTLLLLTGGPTDMVVGLGPSGEA
jgi:flagellar biogenesis protein FliO